MINTMLVIAAIIALGIAYGVSGRDNQAVRKNSSYNRIGVERYVLEREKCLKVSKFCGFGVWRKMSPTEMLLYGVLRQGLPRADTQSGKSELYGLNDTKKYSAMYAGS